MQESAYIMDVMYADLFDTHGIHDVHDARDGISPPATPGRLGA